jgi:hypothetical protein
LKRAGPFLHNRAERTRRRSRTYHTASPGCM